MRANGFPARAEQVLLTAGAQHGIWVAVNALTKPDDLVACESLCYPGITSVIHSLGRRVIGVPMDGEGMAPDALRDLCQRQRPALIICVATCQNPSTAVMSAERRKAIAEIAREFDTALLDDDIYGFLSPSPIAPLATFAPERTAYLTSLSKSVAPSVRLGYMHCPPEWLPRMTASVRMSIWMVSPLAAQVGTNLVATGKALEMARAQRDEAEARQRIAAEVLGAFEFRAQPTSFHLWLKLPQHWTSGDQFAAMARGHQLLLAGGDSFSANRDGEGRQFVRIALLASTRERMRFALAKLAGLLGAPDSPWL
jgi:DNA-binding transcriptional MocR family regulator